jgi:hypothetical protein
MFLKTQLNYGGYAQFRSFPISVKGKKKKKTSWSICISGLVLRIRKMVTHGAPPSEIREQKHQFLPKSGSPYPSSRRTLPLEMIH